jgi:hypothetical protein
VEEERGVWFVCGSRAIERERARREGGGDAPAAGHMEVHRLGVSCPLPSPIRIPHPSHRFPHVRIRPHSDPLTCLVFVLQMTSWGEIEGKRKREKERKREREKERKRGRIPPNGMRLGGKTRRFGISNAVWGVHLRKEVV